MVNFEITNKVALITGGASGLGFLYALALLEKGARAVTLADINQEAGNHAVKEIESKYGKNKVIFVKTDVTNYEEFEDAFKKTVGTFQNIDILINNAGILRDDIWEREIAINLNGTVHGVLLALENYLPKYKSGAEAVIVNISSVAGVSTYESIPVYSATKYAINGLTFCWGKPLHFNRNKVRIVGICPGLTFTPMALELGQKTLGPGYKDQIEQDLDIPPQKPEQVPPFLMQIIESAETGTVWIIEGGQPPYQYEMPDRLEITKKFIS